MSRYSSFIFGGYLIHRTGDIRIGSEYVDIKSRITLPGIKKSAPIVNGAKRQSAFSARGMTARKTASLP